MDADTTVQKASVDESLPEEVTTTGNENVVAVHPCSDSETGQGDDGVVSEDVKVPNTAEAKQLEIVVMEEGQTDEDISAVHLNTSEQQEPETELEPSERQETQEESMEVEDKEAVVEGGSTNFEEVAVQVTDESKEEKTSSEEVPASSSAQEEQKLDVDAPDSSADIGASEQDEEERSTEREETKTPRRRGRSSRKSVLNQNVPADGKVEKVLQMKYRRSIKHYLVHWKGKDTSHDTWLILDPSIPGFIEQVGVYDEERKRANDRGEGASSKKTSRTKHSWYYLSSSEDEDSILKDNFWKNLDEGKLNLYQSSADLYTAVKEVGRSSKAYNQEVCAAIPEDYLAETKRVTRSRVLTPAFKKRKQKSGVHKNTESDSTETNSLTKKETPKPRKQVQKTPAKTESAKKESTKSIKREGTAISGNVKKKIKSDKSDVVSRTSLEEDDDEDDQESEDDVSEMLVPITSAIPEDEKLKKAAAEEQKVQKPRKKSAVAKTPQKAKEPEPITDEDDDSSSSSDEEDEVKEVKDVKAKDVEREEKLKRLEQSIDAVIEESRLWYEEHFGDDSSDDSKNNASGKTDQKPSGNDEEEEDDEDEGKKKKGKPSKRKKGWTSFLEVDSKKKKVKLEKFEDEKDRNVDGSNVEDSSKSESLQVETQPIKEEDKSSVKDEKNSKASVVEESEKAAETAVPEKLDAKVDEDSIVKKDVGDSKEADSSEKKPLESAQTLKLMDAQTKLELAKKVSQYIMKGAFDKKDKKSSSDESSKSSSSTTVSKSVGKEESSESSEKSKKENETVRKTSVDESKHAKDSKKTLGPSFNLKLMRPEDIASKREKMARTHIDSSRPTNVQFLMAIKSNDIVKVKTMLENVGQLNLEFIDMKTGLSLVWLAVKNNLTSILILLATHGADVEKRNRDGLTPLLYAADKGFFQTVHTLCQLGVNLYAAGPDGDTAVVKAIKNRHRNVVQVLLGAGIGLGESSMADKNLIQLAKHVGSNEVIEVINFHKTRLNKELLLRASQCFESSVKIEQPVFPVQCFRMIDSRHFKVFFRHELQLTKKTKGMLLFIGHGQVSHNDINFSLKGRSQVTRVVLNDHQLQSISDESNFVFAFSPLVEGSNRLDIYTQPLTRDNYQMHLLACAYTIELNLGIAAQ